MKQGNSNYRYGVRSESNISNSVLKALLSKFTDRSEHLSLLASVTKYFLKVFMLENNNLKNTMYA